MDTAKLAYSAFLMELQRTPVLMDLFQKTWPGKCDAKNPDIQSCPDYAPLCLVASIVNPLLGPWSFLLNRHARNHFTNRRIGAANNLYFFVILISVISIFSTLATVVVMVIQVDFRPTQTCPYPDYPDGIDLEFCRNKVTQDFNDVQKFYDIPLPIICHLLRNKNVMGALSLHLQELSTREYRPDTQIEALHTNEGEGSKSHQKRHALARSESYESGEIVYRKNVPWISSTSSSAETTEYHDQSSTASDEYDYSSDDSESRDADDIQLELEESHAIEKGREMCLHLFMSVFDASAIKSKTEAEMNVRDTAQRLEDEFGVAKNGLMDIASVLKNWWKENDPLNKRKSKNEV